MSKYDKYGSSLDSMLQQEKQKQRGQRDQRQGYGGGGGGGGRYDDRDRGRDHGRDHGRDRDHQHRHRNRQSDMVKNTGQLKQTIQARKDRINRFGDDHVTRDMEKDMKHMEKVLQWSEHKMPPIPILKDSNIITDSLLLYGVDYMSTDDVKKYFKNYSNDNTADGELKDLIVKWIDDSSCVVQLPTEPMARKAFENLKLSSKRMDDLLPPLTLFLQDMADMKMKEFQKKQQYPDVDVLFEQVEQPQPNPEYEKELTQEELDAMVDPRNRDPNIGFVDVIGYRLTVGNQDKMKKLPINLNTWQNLWVRYATDTDQKNKNTAGKNSRYYKMLQQVRQQQQNNNNNNRNNRQVRGGVPLKEGSKKIVKERHAGGNNDNADGSSKGGNAKDSRRRQRGDDLDDGDDDDEQEDNINQQPPEDEEAAQQQQQQQHSEPGVEQLVQANLADLDDAELLNGANEDDQDTAGQQQPLQ